jgi:hypothetical protein
MDPTHAPPPPSSPPPSPPFPPSPSSPLLLPLPLGLRGGRLQQAGRPVRPRGPPCRHGRWRAPLGLPPPRPKGRGGGRREEGEGGKWGKGGPGFHPVPPFPRPSLPHLWAGPPNFGASVVFTARLVQKSEKTIGQHNYFSTTPN